MTDDAPYDPASAAKPLVRGRSDTPPPAAPRELDPTATERRAFEHDGRDWIAWVSGKSACGTGSYGLGLLEAVHFADARTPDRPVREALLARGRFAHMHDSELRLLVDGATPIILPGDRS